jgi:hypothetical protein
MPTLQLQRQPQEWQEACWLIQWKETMLPYEDRLRWLFHCPNGEYRDKRTAVKLKAMGVLPGVADYVLPVPIAPFAGCFMELKRSGLTPAQAWAACTPDEKRFLQAVRQQGYAGVVASGWVQAAELLCQYLLRPDLLP